MTDTRINPAGPQREGPRRDVFEALAGSGSGTFTEQLREVVNRAGDRLAVVDARRRVSYRELWDAAARLAGGLRAAGCRPGDRVCLDQPNGVEWVESALGVLFAGCVAVPLDQRATRQYRDHVRADCGARLVLEAGAATGGPGAIAPGEPYVHDPYIHDTGPDDLALLLYTSGTTGTPKGVMLSHANLASYRAITASLLPRDLWAGEFRTLIAVPLFHSAGCNYQLLPTLVLGGTAVITPGSGPDSILPMILQYAPEVMFAVPVVYRRLLDATAGDRSALRCLREVHFGAASTPPTLIRELREALPWARLGNAFGMTEISNVALFLPHEHMSSSEGSVGFPVPGVECEIREADAAGRGALYLRGPNMSVGYWRRPDLTEQAFGTGWIRSGDIAEIGADGAIYLRDRYDDVINRGGEKIYSISVEEALLELPGVTDAAVVGLPDPELGARVAALVVMAPGAPAPTPAGLRDALRGRLPAHAIPQAIRVSAGPLPRGTSGKILKREVEARF
jgi:acyl-CoA synthetase (AMP-forming)/AMP-acid ligase II